MNDSLTQLFDLFLVSRLLCRLQFLLRLFTRCLSLLKLDMNNDVQTYFTALHFWGLSFKHKHGLQTIFHHLDRFRKNALDVAIGRSMKSSLPRHISIGISQHERGCRRIGTNCHLWSETIDYSGTRY